MYCLQCRQKTNKQTTTTTRTKSKTRIEKDVIFWQNLCHYKTTVKFKCKEGKFKYCRDGDLENIYA